MACKLSRSGSLGIVLAVWAALALMRAAAPSTLADKDQPRVACYVLDVVDRGRWILQYSDGNDFATKPPLYPWISAAISLSTGKVNDATLLAPALIFSLLGALTMWGLGRHLGVQAGRTGYWEVERPVGQEQEDDRPVALEYCGNALGCVAALVWIFTYHIYRLQWTARTDMLVAALTLAALGANARLQREHFEGQWGWRGLFWLAVALGLLAKGPVILAAVYGALVVEMLVRRSFRPLTAHWPLLGLPLALAAFFAWFGAAWHVGGEAFWNRVVKGELIDHLVKEAGSARESKSYFYYLPVFAGRFAPWSLVLLAALPRWGRERLLGRDHPFAAPAAWTLGILLAFSLIRAKRPDHILPVYGPASLLVGVVILDWMRQGWAAFGWRKKDLRWRFSPEADPGMKGRMRIFALILALVLLFFAAYFQFWSEGARTGDGDRARRFGLAAKAIIEKNPAPLYYFYPQNSIVQFYMRTNDVPLESSNVAETLHAMLRGLAPADKAASQPAGPKFVWIIMREESLIFLQKKLGGDIQLETRLRGDDPKRPSNSFLLLRAALAE